MPALAAIIAGGANDQILASEITEATTAQTNATGQLALDQAWETNIDAGTPNLDDSTLNARIGQLTPRNSEISAREAEILVTLNTRESPQPLYAARFFWVGRRARLNDGTLSQSVKFTKGLTSISNDEQANANAIDTSQDLLDAQ